ncbi:MAG: hypothetical protein ACR2JF_13940 [Iamia sp.]
MASTGLGADLLLANEVVDRRRLATMVASTLGARITVAVDSPETVTAAAAAGVRLHVVRDDQVVDTWAVDLRGWDPPVP